MFQTFYENGIVGFVVGAYAIEFKGYLLEKVVVFEEDDTYAIVSGFGTAPPSNWMTFMGVKDLLL